MPTIMICARTDSPGPRFRPWVYTKFDNGWCESLHWFRDEGHDARLYPDADEALLGAARVLAARGITAYEFDHGEYQ